ncbi:MAG TPA: hypothetical protein VNT30_00860 [Stellaceae bacterium]|nr:hypothetical protein [Stellaceae bacterium]
MPDDCAQDAPKPSGSLLDEVRSVAVQLIEEQKNRAAEVVHVLADALRQTGDTMGERDDKLVAHYANRAAEGVEHLSQAVRTKTLSGLAEDTAEFARRQPKLFVVSAAAVGFLLGQLIHGGGKDGGAAEGPRKPADLIVGRDI